MTTDAVELLFLSSERHVCLSAVTPDRGGREVNLGPVFSKTQRKERKEKQPGNWKGRRGEFCLRSVARVDQVCDEDRVELWSPHSVRERRILASDSSGSRQLMTGVVTVQRSAAMAAAQQWIQL